MKKNIIVSMLTLLFIAGLINNAQAQDKPKPVRDLFNGSLLIDQQTVVGPWKGGLEMHIHHRFGTMQNGLQDIFGIYAPSNIRLGLDYGVTDKLMIGWGMEKNNKLQEFLIKYNILQQRKEGMPISLSYFANMAIDTRDSEVFGTNYAFTNRFSYFHQLIVAKKFGERISVQLAPSFTHFNAVDSVWNNDYFGISAGGRVKLFGDFSVIAEYSQGFSQKAVLTYQNAPTANMAIGFEIGTPTHCFQLFAANYDKITQQANYAFNQNTWGNKKFLVGMNVIVRF